MTPLERVLSRAIRLDSGCLVLPNHEDHPDVYPSVRLDNGKTARANRLVWESLHGPTDLLICHTCDYPRCFAIEHLFAGTQAQNMKDMAAKARHEYPAGEAAWNYQGGATYDMAAYHRQWRANQTAEQKEARRLRINAQQRARYARKKEDA